MFGVGLASRTRPQSIGNITPVFTLPLALLSIESSLLSWGIIHSRGVTCLGADLGPALMAQELTAPGQPKGGGVASP